MSEISSIGRLRHRNLVQLIGWCRKRGDLLLVYDFMGVGVRKEEEERISLVGVFFLMSEGFLLKMMNSSKGKIVNS